MSNWKDNIARYNDAIQWLILNEDRDMIDNFIAEPPRIIEQPSSCVTVAMALVRDVWNKTENQLREDLENMIDDINDPPF